MMTLFELRPANEALLRLQFAEHTHLVVLVSSALGFNRLGFKNKIKGW